MRYDLIDKIADIHTHFRAAGTVDGVGDNQHTLMQIGELRQHHGTSIHHEGRKAKVKLVPFFKDSSSLWRIQIPLSLHTITAVKCCLGS